MSAAAPGAGGKQLIERVAMALHEAMRHSPYFGQFARGSWGNLALSVQSEYRAVTHSALVAAGPTEVWIVTDETECSDDERQMSSVIVAADSRDAALAYLKENYGGVEDCIWQDHDNGGFRFSTRYGEYTWVMVQQTIEARASAAGGGAS